MAVKSGTTGNGLSQEEMSLRAERRLPCDVTTHNLFTSDSDQPLQAEILDISVNGLRVRMSSAIAVGCQIKIDFEKHLLAGEVRSCRPEASGSFQVGLQITEFHPV